MIEGQELDPRRVLDRVQQHMLDSDLMPSFVARIDDDGESQGDAIPLLTSVAQEMIKLKGTELLRDPPERQAERGMNVKTLLTQLEDAAKSTGQIREDLRESFLYGLSEDAREAKAKEHSLKDVAGGTAKEKESAALASASGDASHGPAEGAGSLQSEKPAPLPDEKMSLLEKTIRLERDVNDDNVASGAVMWDTYIWSEEAAALTLQGHGSTVRSCAFSPSGALLATASVDKTARLWDVATGDHKLTLQGHGGDVRSCAFSPSGTLLATASDDKTARLWGGTALFPGAPPPARHLWLPPGSKPRVELELDTAGKEAFNVDVKTFTGGIGVQFDLQFKKDQKSGKGGGKKKLGAAKVGLTVRLTGTEADTEGAVLDAKTQAAAPSAGGALPSPGSTYGVGSASHGMSQTQTVPDSKSNDGEATVEAEAPADAASPSNADTKQTSKASLSATELGTMTTTLIIPPPTELLPSTTSTYTPMMDVAEKEVLDKFTPYLEGNPRKLKRVINSFNVARLIAERRIGEVKEPTKKAAKSDLKHKLLKLTILTEQWPYRMGWVMQFVEDMQQQHEMYAELREEDTEGKVAAKRLLEHSTMERGAYLKQVLDKVLDAQGGTDGSQGEKAKEGGGEEQQGKEAKKWKVLLETPAIVVYKSVVHGLIYAPAEAGRFLGLDGDPQNFERLLLAEPLFTVKDLLEYSPQLDDGHGEPLASEWMLRQYAFSMNPGILNKIAQFMDELALGDGTAATMYTRKQQLYDRHVLPSDHPA